MVDKDMNPVKTFVLGVDPGLNGAIALYRGPNHPFLIHDMPIFEGKKRRVNETILADWINGWNPSHAICEAVHSMPKQGVASSFSFGQSYGVIRGIVAALDIPATYVPPSTWKRALGLSSDKNDARARASTLFPAQADVFARKKDGDRAEAVLMAWGVSHGKIEI